VAHKASQATHVGASVSLGLSAQAGIRLAFPRLTSIRPDVVTPLAQVVEAALRELRSALPVLRPEELVEAASSVFVEIQAALADREGEHLEGPWRRELWDAQWQPVLALAGQRGLAKRLQLQAAAGKPLTVCFGRRARTLPLPLPHQKQVYPHGDGCGLVHPDSVGRRRPSFRYYCPTCGQQETGRQRKAHSQAVARWQGREPVLTFDERGQPIPAWLGACSACTDDFVTTDLRVRRCHRCRAGHR
jgi:hypothetical protein